MKRFLSAILLFLSVGLAQLFGQQVQIDGELKQWHKVTLSFEGDELSEDDAENPFLEYRLQVTFKKGNKTYVVPGFFAADGSAAETSETRGKVWQVRFRPDELGEWSFTTSFRKGKRIAIDDNPEAGEPFAFDGYKGNFTITASDKTGSDFRSKGRLQYIGERYLQFSGNKEYFLKGGAGSPENLLGYYGFDQTPASHNYEPHANDWKPGDPSWQGQKGKNIIGALNYLASKGMNTVYFLTMNVQGDGKDVWPWNSIDERYRYDCSKLDQWEVVFDHMDARGLMLHLFTQETENELLLDIGELRTQRKLYYRELIARFGHHLGLTWDLGEENGPIPWSPKGQTDQDRKDAAKYIKKNDPYRNHIALHTHASRPSQEKTLAPLLGYEYLTGPSLQIRHPHDVNDITQQWINESQKAQHQWVVALDEIGPADTGAKPDVDDPAHDEMRAEVLWGNLMAGGAGVEWYFGYKFAHNDLKLEDWRSRDMLWDQTRHALDFFREHLPYEKMKAANSLTKNTDDFVFAQNGRVYAIYLPKVVETRLDLTGAKTTFSVKWYNPRTGGKLQKGTVRSVKGGSVVSIGYPPAKEGDWVALLATKKPATKTVMNLEDNSVLTLNALRDFQINPANAASEYYRDEKNGALAINAANKALRDKYAVAYTIFSGKSAVYDLSLSAMTENDGESSYVVKVNGTVLDTVLNMTTEDTYMAVNHNLGKYFVETNDIIQIESKAVTNSKIPENDETAWSRGRWNRLILTPIGLSMEDVMKGVVPFQEKNGFLVVEAESFHYTSANGTPRQWYIRPGSVLNIKNLENHSEGASGNSYIEALPDTRITHDDPLKAGTNFFPQQGTGGMVSYKVNFTTPGKYFVWARAYSSGTEDNGIHVGMDGEWPESGARVQWCNGKNKWTWSDAKRTEEEHCGVRHGVYLDVKTAGDHVISFSMREDGFEMDKWILTTDINYTPVD